MSKKYSYSLSPDLMALLEKEFPIEPLVTRYKEALESSGGTGEEEVDKELFGTFGRNLADRLCEVESGYRDRNAEIVYMVAQKTGHPFPSIQQRLLEMAYLGIMNENKIQFQEISFKRLAYEVDFCVLNRQLTEEISPEVANRIPCRHLCMELGRRIYDNTEVGNVVEMHMLSTISDEKDHCVFSAELTLGEQLKLSGR